MSTMAMAVLKIGTVANSIPPRAESMCCCAMENRRNGTASQVIPSNPMRG